MWSKARSEDKGLNLPSVFFVLGTDAEQLEFADNMVAASGYVVGMLRDLKSNMRVLGKTSRPAAIESLEGTTGAKTGDRRGMAYTLTATTGGTAPIYDDETHGIDITPNA